MNTRKAVPFKWPFPPGAKETGQTRQNRRKGSHSPNFTGNRKGMLTDVIMVVFWGASIPGFMWLGAACGF